MPNRGLSISNSATAGDRFFILRFARWCTTRFCGALDALNDPKQEQRRASMKIGLYSITYLGLWYDGRELTLPEMITAAKTYGYDGIEIDGKRPHGNPLDWPKGRCRE